MSDMYHPEEDEGYTRCICGQWVVCIHQECKGLMTDYEYRKWLAKR